MEGSRAFRAGTLAGVFSLLVLAWEAAAQTVTFRFDPPDGSAFRETLRATKEFLGEEAALPGEITEQSVRYVIQKRDAGYSVIMTPEDPIDPRMSTDVTSALRSLLVGMVVTYELDRDGKLLRVRGVEEALEQARQSIPREAFDLAMSVFQRQGKSARDVAVSSWNDRMLLGLLVGQTVQLDTTYVLRGPITSPIGAVFVADQNLRLSGPITCNGRQCVKLVLRYESQDDAIGRAMTEFLRHAFIQLLALLAPEGDREVAIPDVRFSVDTISGETERWLDPRTGLPYYESTTHTLHGAIHVPDEGTIPLGLRWTNRYTYAYR